MKIWVKLLVRGLTLLLICASCKVYRDVENLKPKTSKEARAGQFDKGALSKLVSGDKIVVTTLSGFEYYMTYSNVVGENIRGSVQKVNRSKVSVEETKEIPIHDIDSLYVRRVSGGATVPVVLVSAFGVFVGGLLIAYALSDGFW
jgi:hypothetical protein